MRPLRFLIYCGIWSICFWYCCVGRSSGTPSDRKAREIVAVERYLKKLNTSRFHNHGCGSWQNRYTQLHKDIMSGKKKPRYLISIAPPQGLADRLGGLITHFIMALLTNRAFLHTAPTTTGKMSLAVEMQNIESEMPQDFMFHPLLMNLTNEGYPSWIDKKKVYGLYLNCGKDASIYEMLQKRNWNLFMKSDLMRMPTNYSDTEQLYVTGNRGFSYNIFFNHHHRSKLVDMGLRPETTFKCAFDYLFKLRPETCGSRCRHIRDQIVSEKNKGTIVIGVQVRMGDQVFESSFDFTQSAASKPAKDSLACARRLSKRFIAAGRNVKFFFISDSVQLRATAKRFFGDQLITDEAADVKHIYENIQDSQSRQKAAIRSAMADMYLFSLANLHVITYTSGFGQKAAFLSESSYKKHIFFGKNGYNCSLSKSIDPTDLATHWSGV